MVQLLLVPHIESKIRLLGIEVDDATAIMAEIDILTIDAMPLRPDAVGGASRAVESSAADDRYWDKPPSIDWSGQAAHSPELLMEMHQLFDPAHPLESVQSPSHVLLL